MLRFAPCWKTLAQYPPKLFFFVQDHCARAQLPFFNADLYFDFCMGETERPLIPLHVTPLQSYIVHHCSSLGLVVASTTWSTALESSQSTASMQKASRNWPVFLRAFVHRKDCTCSHTHTHTHMDAVEISAGGAKQIFQGGGLQKRPRGGHYFLILGYG